MREAADRQRLLAFMEEIGKRTTGPGRIYLVGGSTAILLQTRWQTVDIDLKIDPEPPGVFEAIQQIKLKLNVNIELASPDQFMPPLPGWESRSEFIARKGLVDFYHYDFYAQALAKILRGYERDLKDARDLLRLGKISLEKLKGLFGQIQPVLVRYPSIDPQDFERRLDMFAD